VFNVYPARGGYLIVAIDPEIAGWRENTVGSPSLTAVDWFGAQTELINGLAKNENLALDSIDVGSGIAIHGSSPDATFADVADTDEGNTSNRWGYANYNGSIIVARGIWEIGTDGSTAQATTFTSDGEVVTWPDGYHSDGSFGLLIDLGNASTVVDINSDLISEGADGTEDTRADFTVTGTSGSGDLTGKIKNFNRIVLTSAFSITGADISCQELTQSSADIDNGTTIRTTSLTNVATLDDPTFGTTTDLHDVEFIQEGAGHAIEVTGDATFTNIDFTGYSGTPGSNLVAASGSAAAAILNDTGGLVTISISGGDTPSVRNGSGATTIVQNTKSAIVEVLQPDLTARQNARVFLECDPAGTGPGAAEDTVSITQTGGTATVTHTAHGMVNGDKVKIRGCNEDGYNIIGTVANQTTNAYEYTVDSGTSSPATGSPNATYVIIDELTNASGIADNTAYVYTSDQDVRGRARYSTATPLYKTAILTGTIESTGFSQTVILVDDE